MSRPWPRREAARPESRASPETPQVPARPRSICPGLRSRGADATERGGDLYLLNAHFPEYPSARFNHEPRRPRKLLLRRREINRLMGAIKRDGVTLVPLSIYFNERGRAKLELGLAKGKRKADKREAEKARDWQRQNARIMRERA